MQIIRTSEVGIYRKNPNLGVALMANNNFATAYKSGFICHWRLQLAVNLDASSSMRGAFWIGC